MGALRWPTHVCAYHLAHGVKLAKHFWQVINLALVHEWRTLHWCFNHCQLPVNEIRGLKFDIGPISAFWISLALTTICRPQGLYSFSWVNIGHWWGVRQGRHHSNVSQLLNIELTILALTTNSRHDAFYSPVLSSAKSFICFRYMYLFTKPYLKSWNCQAVGISLKNIYLDSLSVTWAIPVTEGDFNFLT